MSKPVCKSLLALGALLLTPIVYGGVAIEVARFGVDREEAESTISIQVQSGLLRMDQIDAEQKHSRLLFTGEQLFDIDMSGKHHAVIERDRIRAAQRTSDPTAAFRADLLAEVPPAHLHEVERLMSQPPGWARESAQVEITSTMRAYTPLSTSCRVYRVRIDQRLKFEYCVADDLPAFREFMMASEAANALLSDFFEVLEMPWMMELMRVEWTHAYGIPGVPLWVREIEAGKTIEEFRVLSVRERKLRANVFLLPEGLRRRAVLDFSFDEQMLGGPQQDSE